MNSFCIDCSFKFPPHFFNRTFRQLASSETTNQGAELQVETLYPCNLASRAAFVFLAAIAPFIIFLSFDIIKFFKR